MRYRKKPIVIDAVRWGGRWPEPGEPLTELELLVGDPPGTSMTRNADGTLTIHTLEGDMLANIGDWVIRGVKGELYPCKPDIFEATYEAVG